MKKWFIFLFIACMAALNVGAKQVNPVSGNLKLPDKYTPEYMEILRQEYKKVSNEEVIYIALDMMKGTTADFSRKAILGYNLTQTPIKISFKNLTELNESYTSFDAVGWKKRSKLYIYINPKHENAPPAALAALLAHEALHQDEYNSLSEETYAWTMEAAVWNELVKQYPEANDLESALVARENVLKQLLEKGNYTDKYIKKTVYSNPGYKNLPITSPGYNAD